MLRIATPPAQTSPNPTASNLGSAAAPAAPGTAHGAVQLASLPGALLETILDRLAILFLTGAGGDLAAARHAAISMLMAHHPGSEDELTVAAEIISFGFHALDALGQCADPTLSVNQKLRLQGRAVSLSRESHKARHRLDQMKKAPPSPTQPADAMLAGAPSTRPQAAEPQPPQSQFARAAGATVNPAGAPPPAPAPLIAALPLPAQPLPARPLAAQTAPAEPLTPQSSTPQSSTAQSAAAQSAAAQSAAAQAACLQPACLQSASPQPGGTPTGTHACAAPATGSTTGSNPAPQATVSHTTRQTWTQAFQQHQRAKRIAENLKKNQSAVPSTAATAIPTP